MKTKIISIKYLKFLLYMITILMLSSQTGEAFRYLEEGMEAPVLSGVDLISGKKIDTNDWKNNGATIIVFWAIWSERSLTELSDLAEMSVRFEDKPVHFIAVNVDGQSMTKQLKEKISDQINNLNISFASIIDYEMEYFDKFGVIAVPSTAIVNSSGIIRYAPAGYSYTIQDKLIDSIETLPGIKKTDTKKILKARYSASLEDSPYYGLALPVIDRQFLCRFQKSADNYLY